MSDEASNREEGHVTLEVAEKARDRAYFQGRKDAEAEAQRAKDARWIMDLDKIDVVQARAQIEALRAIAEELAKLRVLIHDNLANLADISPLFLHTEEDPDE